MKQGFAKTPLAAFVLTVGCGLAVAQSPSTTRSTATGIPAKQAGIRDAQGWERAPRVSKILGMDVVNRHGEKIGGVEDIVLDTKANIAYAVVSTGAFIGIGDRLHAVPWTSLRINAGNDSFLLDVDRDLLRSAPGFDRSNWPDVTDPKWISENRRYFSAKANPAGGGK